MMLNIKVVVWAEYSLLPYINIEPSKLQFVNQGNIFSKINPLNKIIFNYTSNLAKSPLK